LMEKWKDFSNMAMRFVSMGTIKAEVERLISVHHDVSRTK
jgi:hypothetical protein